MGVTFIGASTATAGGSGLIIAKPAGVQQGDIMFLVMVMYVNPSTPPSGWTFMGGDGFSSQQSYRIAGASEPSSYTVSSDTFNGSCGCIVAYRGNRRDVALEPVLDGNVNFSGNQFTFSQSVSFLPPNSQGTQQRSGLIYFAGAALQQNGSSESHSWPPANMTSRVNFATPNTKGVVLWADRFDLPPPVTLYTPADFTFSHTGGSSQGWTSFTTFINRRPNPLGVV